jgi:hypothetical protein
MRPLTLLLALACGCDGQITVNQGDPERRDPGTGPMEPMVPPVTGMPPPGPMPEMCDSSTELLPKNDVWWLSRGELAIVFKQHFGATIADTVKPHLNQLSLKAETWNFDQTTSSVAKEDVKTYFDVAGLVANAAYDDVTVRARVFGQCTTLPSCPATGACPQSCIDAFLGEPSTRIWRRPLTAVEKAEITASITRTAANAREAFVNALTYELFSPVFLARWELGADARGARTELANREYDLTAHEIATRIAFATTDRGPDADLLARAADPNPSTNLLNEEVARAQTARMMETPEAREKFRDLGFYWMRSPLALEFDQYPNAFVGTTDTRNLAKASIDETRTFVEHVIWSGQSSFRELLTSRASFASDPGLAAVYGHSAVTGTAPATFGDPSRRGVFGRLPFLYSPSTRSRLVRRSLDFRQQVLCETLGSPPAVTLAARDNFVVTDEIAKTLSTRDYFAAITGTDPNRPPNECTTCHKFINPTGNVFEGFDSLGRSRTHEVVFDAFKMAASSVAINSSGSVPVDSLGNLSVANSGELVAQLADASQVQRCFAKNLASFALTQRFNSTSSCLVADVHDHLTKSGGGIKQAIVAAVAHPELKRRRRAE